MVTCFSSWRTRNPPAPGIGRVGLCATVRSNPKKTTPKNAAATPTPDSPPEIEITFDEHIVVDEPIAIIKDDPALYPRGNALVMVARASSAGKKRGVVQTARRLGR